MNKLYNKMQINYAAAQTTTTRTSNNQREKTSLFRCLIKPQIDKSPNFLNTYECGH